MLDLGQGREIRFDFCERVRDRELFAEENFVGLFQRALGFFGNIISIETDLVDRARHGGIAVGEHVRRNVLHDFGAAADDRVSADAAELVDGGEAADDGVVFDYDMAREGRDVRHDHVVAEDHIMREVAVSEDVIARADDGGFAV